MKILQEIQEEVNRQIIKWGYQSHPSVDLTLINREGGCTPERMCEEYEIPSETRAKQLCEIHNERGDLTWSHILVEELSEAICAKTDDDRRAELIQIAAVAVSWIQDIDNKNRIVPNIETITLYRPVNEDELTLIKNSGYKSFPKRLSFQPFFYPVLNEQYAIEITKEWNVPAYGVGYVTAFDVKADYVRSYQTQTVGGDLHKELWIPAEKLDEFNSNIIGKIKVIGTFK